MNSLANNLQANIIRTGDSMNNKMNNKKVRKVLALTLGLGLAVGSLTMGTSTIVHASQKPAEIQNMQMNDNTTVNDNKTVNDKQNSQDANNKQNLKEMLKLLKIDEPTFAQEQTSGKSLAEIAATHNVSRQAVLDLVVKNMNRQINQGVKDKSITKEQATAMRTNAATQAQQVVDGKAGASDRQLPRELLTLLQIDEQTFKQEADSGKSLAEIGAAHNVSRQAVIDVVVKDMNENIDKGLAEKRITAEQATEMKTNYVAQAQQMVDQKMAVQSPQPNQPSQPQK